MVYDPAWDMPEDNWMPQASFCVAVPPPAVSPDAGTPVCVGPFAREWLPYVLGAMDQLRNPSTWIPAADAVMYQTLADVTRLKQIFSLADTCMSYALRFTDECQLQFSVDGGTSWTPVDGWDDNLCQCVKKCVPVIGIPPNPDDQTHDQLACSIASYLAEKVIRASIEKAVAGILSDLALIDIGAEIITLIPEFVLVGLAFDAFAFIYTFIAHGTISDFEDALDDSVLWQDVACAIFQAIRTDGYVTVGNFPTILTNIAAISYVHSGVVDAIHGYVEALGATGLAQLSQRAGLMIGAECLCGSWCYRWGPGSDDLCGGRWTVTTGGFGTCATNIWTGVLDVSFYDLAIEATFDPPIHITAIHTIAEADGEYTKLKAFAPDGTTLLDQTPLTWDGPVMLVKRITYDLEQIHAVPQIKAISLGGPGDNPLGEDNCSPP